MTNDETIKVTAVNAWEGHNGEVVITLRTDDAHDWQTFSLPEKAAVQLADQIRLITKTTD